MIRIRQRLRLLIAVAFLASALTWALVPAPVTQAAVTPDWTAWRIKVDFPNNTPSIKLTTYSGKTNPPGVLTSSEIDLTPQCSVIGSLTYQNGAAIFGGAGYIRCSLATVPKPPQTCPIGTGPLWFASDLTLNQQSASNPILEAPGRMFSYSLPSTGPQARTKLLLGTSTYLSPNWARQASGNRVIIGANGPVVVAVKDYFGWLTYFTDPNWDDFFAANVTGAKIGQWTESPSVSWTTPAVNFQLGKPSSNDFLYIGYSSNTKAYFTGTLRSAEVDPPGCRGG